MTAPLPNRHREALARAVRVAARLTGQRNSRTVAAFLYTHWYTQLSHAKPTGWTSPVPFVTRLRQALTHAARGRGATSLDQVVARQGFDPASGYWWLTGGPRGQVSALTIVGSGLERTDTGSEDMEPGVRRVYWNVIQQHAPVLVHDLVATLPDTVRWHAKVPVVAPDFLRPDALVLYVEARAWHALLPLVCTLAATHRAGLHTDVPPLTSWIDEGVASASDPGIPGESFGLALCRRVAEVLCRGTSAPGAGTDCASNHEVGDVMGALECALFGQTARGANRGGRRTQRRRQARGHG